jgi:hypothetical protein
MMRRDPTWRLPCLLAVALTLGACGQEEAADGQAAEREPTRSGRLLT